MTYMPTAQDCDSSGAGWSSSSAGASAASEISCSAPSPFGPLPLPLPALGRPGPSARGERERAAATRASAAYSNARESPVGRAGRATRDATGGGCKRSGRCAGRSVSPGVIGYPVLDIAGSGIGNVGNGNVGLMSEEALLDPAASRFLWWPAGEGGAKADASASIAWVSRM